MNFLKNSETTLASGTVTKPIVEECTMRGYISKNGSNYFLYRTTVSNSSNKLFTVSNGDHTRFTATTKCKFSASAAFGYPTYTTRAVELKHYNSSNVLVHQTQFSGQTSIGSPACSLVGELEVGDYLVVVAGVASNDDETTNFSITAIATEEVSQNLTVTLPNSKENSKVYDKTLVSVTGTNSWVTDHASFVPYVVIDKATGSHKWRVRFNIRGSQSSASGTTLTVAGVTFGENVYQDVSVHSETSATPYYALAVANTSTIVTALSAPTTNANYSGDVALTGKPSWADDYIPPSVYIGGVSKTSVAFLKDVKASGSHGGPSTSNTVHIRTLNNVSGDTQIVSLSSNQFTLQAGEYDIEASAPAASSNNHQIFLYDVAGSYIVDGSSEYFPSTQTGQTRSFLRSKINISSATTYEIRHWVSVGTASQGLGIASDNHASNPQTQEVYTTVKITQLVKY